MAILEAIPEKLIVAFVVSFITYLQTTTNFYILGPALGGWFTLRAQQILGPMNILLISLYVNYYLACTTDPGSIPEGWEPPHSVMHPKEDAVIQVGITGPRFCKKCDSYKPPRSHHCKHCGRCVLRMDHHCPWIGNCVGFANYSHFVRFVFSVIGCCTYGCYLLLWRLQRILDARQNRWMQPKPSMTELMVVSVNVLLICLTILLVGVLAVYHTYCLFKGQTTIEGWERTKATRLVRRGKIDPVEFPFDTGFYSNICSVLGHNPLLWAWPKQSPGDGLKYAVKPNTDPLIPYSWPPRDPKDLGPSIIERVEKDHRWEGPKLVRRDSEGYLVREITMEDRMMMLQSENAEFERDQYEAQEHHMLLEEQQLMLDENSEQYLEYQEYEQVELDPNDYYYDSNSVTSDLSDEEGETANNDRLRQVQDEDGWVDED